MAGFTDQSFIKKLNELNKTPQSIQTLSLWLIHHRKHSRKIVQIWYKELKKTETNRKVIFMYLANDVIQNSRKKTTEFTKEFGYILSKAFAHVALSDSTRKTSDKLARILTVWRSRNIYSREVLEDFGQCLRSQPEVTKLSPKSESMQKKKKVNFCLQEQVKVIEVPYAGVPPDPDDIIKTITDLANPASLDAEVREKIASLPPEVTDSSLLSNLKEKLSAKNLSKDVEEACLLVNDYNDRLSHEIEERKKVSEMLGNYIYHQKEQISHTEQKLTEYKAKLEKVMQTQHEIRLHLQNLPDLEHVQILTEGLAPLPAAGDLFRNM